MTSYGQFRRHLKARLSGSKRNRSHCGFSIFLRYTNTLTYLLTQLSGKRRFFVQQRTSLLRAGRWLEAAVGKWTITQRGAHLLARQAAWPTLHFLQ